jgi:outer membrane protein TolC
MIRKRRKLHDANVARAKVARRAIAAALCVGLFAACGSSGKSSVHTAQARVNSKQRDVADAQQTFDTASAAFCTDAKTYIERWTDTESCSNNPPRPSAT